MKKSEYILILVNRGYELVTFSSKTKKYQCMKINIDCISVKIMNL